MCFHKKECIIFLYNIVESKCVYIYANRVNMCLSQRFLLTRENLNKIYSKKFHESYTAEKKNPVINVICVFKMMLSSAIAL